MVGGGSGQAGELPNITVYLRAQYVWGPGDNGVDELLCQVEPDNSLDAPEGDGGTNGHGPRGKPWYILTDAQGDVVSMVEVGQDLNGNPVTSVAGQWTYSPYGEVLTYDELSPHPAVVFGHKTLVMDRLDGPTLTWQDESEPGAEDWTFFETRRLEPGARLIAYARNRTLDVQRGRWLQVDPNASGTTLVSQMFHGDTSRVNIALNATTRLGDGLSLYSFCRSMPICGKDPLGLFLLGDLAASSGVRGMLAGGLFGGIMGGRNPEVGMVRGALIGAIGGGYAGVAFGMTYNALSSSAYAASALGLLGQLGISGMAGGAAGSASGQLLSDGSIDSQQLALDTMVGGALSLAIGGIDPFMRAAFSSTQGSGQTLLQRYIQGSGGRWGSSATRQLNNSIALQYEQRGYTIVGGAGRAAEEYIPPPGGGRSRGTYVDITMTNGQHTIRIQTISTTATGAPTPSEAAGSQNQTRVSNRQANSYSKMTTSKQTHFYARKNDLLLVLDQFEQVASVRYVKFGPVATLRAVQYRSFRSIPSATIATSPSSITSQAYVIMKELDTPRPRPVQIETGDTVYMFDQLLNPDTAVLSPGGEWESGTLGGRIAILSNQGFAKNCYLEFVKAMRSRFVKIKSYWVGPEALEFLRNGGRLTQSMQSPSEFDLKE